MQSGFALDHVVAPVKLSLARAISIRHFARFRAFHANPRHHFLSPLCPFSTYLSLQQCSRRPLPRPPTRHTYGFIIRQCQISLRAEARGCRWLGQIFASCDGRMQSSPSRNCELFICREDIQVALSVYAAVPFLQKSARIESR